MAYTRRTEEERAELAARAQALRAVGATLAEISRAVGVPAPTLTQWAARDGWRVRDLESAGAIRFPIDTGKKGKAFEAKDEPDCAMVEGADVSTYGAPVTQKTLEAASERALRLALVLADRGEARASREQLLLGQRFSDVAKRLAAAGPAPEEAREEARQMLEDRLVHLISIEHRKEVAEALGVEPLYCHDLDTTHFRDASGKLRKATDEERARIEAGDWPKTTRR